MTKLEIAEVAVHKLPEDLLKALTSAPLAFKVWESLTPLARNEWICWIVSVKQLVTKMNHIERTVSELQQGKRRPCCWMGCIHRTDKLISPSVQWVLDKHSKSYKTAK